MLLESDKWDKKNNDIENRFKNKILIKKWNRNKKK
jgi:hypothetical protein